MGPVVEVEVDDEQRFHFQWAFHQRIAEACNVQRKERRRRTTSIIWHSGHDLPRMYQTRIPVTDNEQSYCKWLSPPTTNVHKMLVFPAYESARMLAHCATLTA